MVCPIPQRNEFILNEGLVYLNHAGVAPIPQRAARAVSECAMLMSRQGAWDYTPYRDLQQRFRQRAAWLVGGDEAGICPVANTSEGLSMVGLGLNWRPGDEIVTTDQEFPSNKLIWSDLSRRHDLVLHQVPADSAGRILSQDLLARVNGRTRILALSSVQFRNGAVADLPALGAALGHTPTLLVVDGIQSLGLLPMEAASWGLDAVVADGHKWLLGPEGCGLMYLSPKALAQVEPRLLGWHSQDLAGDYDRPARDWRPGALRFQAGSPNLLGMAGLDATLDMLQEIGIAPIQRRVHQLMEPLTRGVQELGGIILTPLGADGLPEAGILVFSHPQVAMPVLSRGLQERGIFHAVRGGGIRLSPHFYQAHHDMMRALSALEECLNPRHRSP
ncbi:MAG: aminotransferase class V-fold PLP-dependent enzyme [Magnetococcus sp. WYHC-3]